MALSGAIAAKHTSIHLFSLLMEAEDLLATSAPTPQKVSVGSPQNQLVVNPFNPKLVMQILPTIQEEND